MLRGTPFTRLQGQYLAFIDLYTKLHRRAPAEADMQAYFKVTAPSVHRMVVALAKRGLVARIPGQSRSIKILVPQNQLPELE
jgi:Mn-dependent DtxR family transcriptional regulator